MAVSISISIVQNSQNVVNNTSNVTVTVKASWTQGSHNALVNASGVPQAKGWVKIDGQTYDFASTFNTGKTTSGSQTICTKTVNVSHAANGSKTLSCSASYTTGVSSGTVTASASKALTTIPRVSKIYYDRVAGVTPTLGVSLRLRVERQSTSFTHTIEYSCGSASGEICNKSTSTSVTWTPPIELAVQNTTGTSITVTFNIDTYSGNTKIGSDSRTLSIAIPDSAKPSINRIAIVDVNGIVDIYGAFVKGLSQVEITITPTLAYDSPIASYSTSINGVKYTGQTFKMDVTKSGISTAVTTITDKRGRTAMRSWNIEVLDYTPPVIHTLAVHRVNVDGIEDDQGEYALVSAHAAVTNLSGKNTPKWVLKFKKSTETTFTEYVLGSTVGYVWNGDLQAFPADTGSSYDIVLEISDNHSTTKRATSVSTAFTIMNWSADGTGMGIGKVAEESNLLDIGMPTRFNNPVCGKVMGLDKLPEIPLNSDFNDYLTTGCWATYRNDDAATMLNVPIPKAGRLEVSAATGEGIRVSEWSYLRQKFIPYSLIYPVYERDISRDTSDVWSYGEWVPTTLSMAASEKVYSKAAMTIALNANATLGVVNNYTTIPFDKNVISTSDRLTLASNSIRIGPNISHIKVSGQTLVKCGDQTGNRHARIQKVSGGVTTSIAWTCIHAVATGNTLYSFAPVIVPVKEGDLLRMVYYTGDADDSNVSGSSANGWQSYMTVEEL